MILPSLRYNSMYNMFYGFIERKRGVDMKAIRIIVLVTVFWSLQVVSTQAAILDEIKFHVENFYFGTQPTNLKKLTSIDQVESKLDGFSEYLTKEEYQLYKNSINNPVSGIQNLASFGLSVIPNVSSKMLYGQVGYIRLHSFSEDAKLKVESEWKSLKSQGAKHIIFDLRYNGGGYVDSAVQLLGLFPSVPNAYNLQSRAGATMVTVKPSVNQFPINPSILINSYTASASEIMAIAVKDSKAGTLIGQKTFGKGSIQSFYELSDEGALKLTTSHFKGPKGSIVNGVGIQPNQITVAGKEISAAHMIQIEKQLRTKLYKQTSPLNQVPTTKTITVKFSHTMPFNEEQDSPRIELVKMGGKAVPITWTKKDETSLVITPTQLLEKNETYMLIVHPQFTNQDGVAMRKGSYTIVTVKAN